MLLTSVCTRSAQGTGPRSLPEQAGPQRPSCHTAGSQQREVAMHSRATVAYTNHHLVSDLMSPEKLEIWGFV